MLGLLGNQVNNLYFIFLEIEEFQIEDDDKFILIASDGIWEFLSNNDVVRIIKNYRERGDLEGACDRLMQESLLRWEIEEEGGIDDITFILIFLN